MRSNSQYAGVDATKCTCAESQFALIVVMGIRSSSQGGACASMHFAPRGSLSARLFWSCTDRLGGDLRIAPYLIFFVSCMFKLKSMYYVLLGLTSMFLVYAVYFLSISYWNYAEIVVDFDRNAQQITYSSADIDLRASQPLIGLRTSMYLRLRNIPDCTIRVVDDTGDVIYDSNRDESDQVFVQKKRYQITICSSDAVIDLSQVGTKFF